MKKKMERDCNKKSWPSDVKWYWASLQMICSLLVLLSSASSPSYLLLCSSMVIFLILNYPIQGHICLYGHLSDIKLPHSRKYLPIPLCIFPSRKFPSEGNENETNIATNDNFMNGAIEDMTSPNSLCSQI